MGLVAGVAEVQRVPGVVDSETPWRPGVVDSETPWRDLAACKGADQALFFPVDKAEDHSDPAKAICRDCPVSEPCLRFALENGERGVWGGTSEAERKRIIRRRRRW